MSKLTQLVDERISLEAKISDMKKLAEVADSDFNSEQWNTLQEEYKACLSDIEAVSAASANDARQEALNFETKPFVKMESNESVITKQVDSFDQMDKKGYECGGELLADHIAMSMYGRIVGEGRDFKTKRYSHYLQSTDSLNIEQAAGNASTVIDGVEIIPELLGGIKEYGQGSGVAPILNMFSPVSTNRKEVEYYVNEDTYNVDGLVTARVAEGGTLSAQNFNNDLERFRLYKVGVFAAITEEDLQNVPLLESRYMQRAPSVLDVQKVTDIIGGDGVAKPIGITSDKNTAAIAVARATSSEIAWVDIVNMEARAKRGNPTGQWCWLANETALPQLMQVQDGRGAYLWKQNANDGILGDMIPGTLNGKPVIISEDVPAVGSKGGLTLCHTSGYIFGQHTSGTRFAESMHFYFDTDKRALRWLSQYGGRPVFNAAYTPRTGNTLSHFVLLDA